MSTSCDMTDSKMSRLCWTDFTLGLDFLHLHTHITLTHTHTAHLHTLIAYLHTCTTQIHTHTTDHTPTLHTYTPAPHRYTPTPHTYTPTPHWHTPTHPQCTPTHPHCTPTLHASYHNIIHSQFPTWSSQLLFHFPGWCQETLSDTTAAVFIR